MTPDPLPPTQSQSTVAAVEIDHVSSPKVLWYRDLTVVLTVNRSSLPNLSPMNSSSSLWLTVILLLALAYVILAPATLRRRRSSRAGTGRADWLANRLDRVEDRYHEVLAWVLERPVPMLGLALTGLLLSVVLSLALGARRDAGAKPIRVEVTGADARTTAGVAQRIADQLRQQAAMGPVVLEERPGSVAVVASGGYGSLRTASRDLADSLAAFPPPPGYQVTVHSPALDEALSIRRIAVAGVLALVALSLLLAWRIGALAFGVGIPLGVALAVAGSAALLMAIGGGITPARMAGMVLAILLAARQGSLQARLIWRRRRRGMALRVAVVEATRRQLRPVLLNSISLSVGLLLLLLTGGSATGFALAALGGLVAIVPGGLLVMPGCYRLLLALEARVRTRLSASRLARQGARARGIAVR